MPVKPPDKKLEDLPLVTIAEIQFQAMKIHLVYETRLDLRSAPLLNNGRQPGNPPEPYLAANPGNPMDSPFLLLGGSHLRRSLEKHCNLLRFSNQFS